MAEIVNLRQARKRKMRAERERTAQANRVKFGQPGAEKKRSRLEEERAQRAHDAHRRDEETEG